MSIEQRAFGRHADRLSIVGLGGVVLMGQSAEEAAATCARAFEAGVTYFDVAPSYGDAEEKMGPAVAGFRDRIFLACKTTDRTAEGSRAELERSLARLRTDRFDLYQLHALSSLEDVRRAFAPGGAMETFLRAREEGKVRYLGFSAHDEDAAVAALELFDFDSVLVPLNFFAYTRGGFGGRLVPMARGRGCALLALKAMARRAWPEGAERWSQNTWYEPIEDEVLSEAALRWTLFELGATAAVPPGDPRLFERALRLAPSLGPLSEEQRRLLESHEPTERPLFPLQA
ncbi:MAG: aldo/keto reductase [Fimbriimonadales bacterium]|nr:aldo/keto reductase [Fimbriimonadales bacterium]